MALGLLAGGCVDDPREAESSDLRRVIVESLEGEDQDNALHFTSGEARCIADRVMRAITDERLRELGVDEGFGLSLLELSGGEEDVVFEALTSCADVAAQVAATIEADAGVTQEQARCVADRYVTDAVFREALFSRDFDADLNDRIDDTLALAGQACGIVPA